MNALHIISLEGKNVDQFEDFLIYWTKTSTKHFRNSVMLFDKSRLLVGETTNIRNSKHTYEVKLPRFTIEYICISSEMSVLTKVIRTDGKNEKILYTVPEKWSNTYIWYAH